MGLYIDFRKKRRGNFTGEYASHLSKNYDSKGRRISSSMKERREYALRVERRSNAIKILLLLFVLIIVGFIVFIFI